MLPNFIKNTTKQWCIGAEKPINVKGSEWQKLGTGRKVI
jgi:hypothetical protein